MGEVPGRGLLILRLRVAPFVALLLVAWPAAAAPASAADASIDAAANAAGWLRQQQSPEGALPAAGARVDEVAEAAAAVAATGTEPETVARALELVARRGPSETSRGGQAGRAVAGIVGAGADPRRLGGHDFVAHLEQFYDPATGRYDSQVYAHALAMIGVASAGGAVPADAVRYLRVNQCADGGFSHEPGCLRSADTDTTSIVIAALTASKVASDGSTEVLAKARSWLVSARNDDGGFGQHPGEPTNSNSSGLALSAIAALGERPTDDAWTSSRGSAVDALMRLQRADGSFAYMAGGQPDGYAAVQAIPGLLDLAHPLPPPRSRTAAPRPAAGATVGTGSKGDVGGGTDRDSPVDADITHQQDSPGGALEVGGGAFEDERSAQSMKGTSDSKEDVGPSLPLRLAALTGLLGVVVAGELTRRRVLGRGLAGSGGSALRSE